MTTAFKQGWLLTVRERSHAQRAIGASQRLPLGVRSGGESTRSVLSAESAGGNGAAGGLEAGGCDAGSGGTMIVPSAAAHAAPTDLAAEAAPDAIEQGASSPVWPERQARWCSPA